MVKDVVCGMEIDPRQAEAKGLTSTQGGQSYYFCSPGCKKRFEANPAQYVQPAPPPR